MADTFTPGVCAERLGLAQYAQHFGDAHPPLSAEQARLAAERCYYCYDAPCTTACPTGIDVPTFIARIAQGNLRGAADTILQENILGGMCARVCPTEVLCEQACVRNTQESKPVEIGLLQRHATDAHMAQPGQPLFQRAVDTGKRVAVVGAGPAGLAAAHRLALLGHQVILMDARPKLGGLNEYGLATYKTTDGFAQKEIEWLLSIGGITVQLSTRLGRDVQLSDLTGQFDAVFLGVGLDSVHPLGIAHPPTDDVRPAVDWIAQLRQVAHPSQVPVGRRVVVVGGGMTAVDAAVQCKKLGAEEVTMVVRRGPAQMTASVDEQRWALENGVVIRHFSAPKDVEVEHGRLKAIRMAHTRLEGERLVETGDGYTLLADQLLLAIGQQMRQGELDGLTLMGGKLATDANGKTSAPKVWAGGDCRYGGKDLTVAAVQHGKLAAMDIDRALRALSA